MFCLWSCWFNWFRPH